MKAWVVQKPGDLQCVEAEKPVPGPKEVLCRVSHCGICATDYAIQSGTLNLGEGLNPIYPVRIGHEWSGVVEATGSETRTLKAGDHVISDLMVYCGECEACITGHGERCSNLRAIGTIGHHWPGAFAEYMLLPERLLIKLPDSIDLSEAALIEPAAIAASGLLRAPMAPEKTLLILGSGPIGLGGLAFARGLGVGKTILAGRKHAKLNIGRQLGADTVIHMDDGDWQSEVMRETNEKGPDVILDTTGAIGLFNADLEMIAPDGTLVIPGFYEQSVPEVRVDLMTLKNCTIVGTAGTPNVGRKVLSMLVLGRTSLLPMITDRFPFDKLSEAFEAFMARSGTRVKIMIDF
jgi:L-iditol 2-dehydrogenase